MRQTHALHLCISQNICKTSTAHAAIAQTISCKTAPDTSIEISLNYMQDVSCNDVHGLRFVFLLTCLASSFAFEIFF